MNQVLKVSLVAVGIVGLVAGGVVAGNALSGGFARPYTYGPGMMFTTQTGNSDADFSGHPGWAARGQGFGGGMMGGGTYRSNGENAPYGPGMMDGFYRQGGDSEFYGRGMMGGYGMGGMVGRYGMGGMMGAYQPDDSLLPAEGERLTLDGAVEIAEAYIGASGIEGLELAEVMAFSDNFYAVAREESTGIGAFEFLIDPWNGTAFQEYGPNMMWNQQYGHMGAFGQSEMTLSESEARDSAQAYVDDALPGSTVDDHADEFYGYYTFHTLRDGEITGMLSVHGSTGDVWLHTWHGTFIEMVEHELE